MARKCLPLLLALCLLLAACGPRQEAPQDDGTLDLVATTYPVYLFAAEVTRGAEDVTLTLMIDQPISCLHDYTLTVKDMKALERADGILLNGAGLEEAMEDALASVSDTPQIDCSQDITLLEGAESDHHHEEGILPAGHEHEADPHVWMDPNRACQMIQTLADGLAQLDPDQAALYASNAQLAVDQIQQAYPVMQAALADLPCRELITFHDGFSYFADAFDLTILRAIEEEAGSEASAREVADIVTEIQTHQLPAIFTEVNGADVTAQIIHRECGVPVYALTLMMSAGTAYEEPGVATYLNLSNPTSTLSGRPTYENPQARLQPHPHACQAGDLPPPGAEPLHHLGGGEHSPGHLLPAQLPGDRCPHRPQWGGEILPLPEHFGPGPLRRHHPVPPGGGLPRPPQDRLRPPEPQF